MMLDHISARGKILHGEYQRDRDKALLDRFGFTDDDLTFLDITGADGDRTYHPDTWTIDSRRGGRVDIRTRPESGSEDC